MKLDSPHKRPSSEHRLKTTTLWTRWWVWVPAIGLVLLGAWGLTQAADGARAIAREESLRAAQAVARALRARLLNPTVIDSVPPRTRFRLVEGTLELPEELGWLGSPPEEDPEIELPASAASELARARDAEFGPNPDFPGSMAHYERALSRTDLTSRGANWVRLRAAWTAHRARMDARCKALLESIEQESNPYRSVVQGLLLLQARRKDPLAPWALVLVPNLEEAMGRVLLESLIDQGAALGDARTRFIEAHQRRLLLMNARNALGLLQSAQSPVTKDWETGLLLYFPTREGTGEGCVLDDACLEDLAQRWVEGTLPRTVVDATLPPDAVRVAGRLFVLPEGKQVPTLEAWGLPIMGAGLATFLVAGLFLSLRALHRETDAARTRAEFLTSVTHELKTPLASIRLLSEMLFEGRVHEPERVRQYYDLLAGESGRLTVLIENVLDLGRLERGDRRLDVVPLDIEDLVQEASSLLGPLAERDGLRVRCHLHAKPPATSQGDRPALVQAMVNVLDNARKYGKDGGSIDIHVTTTDQRIVIDFRDHGPGIPISEREAIFLKFHRGDAHRESSTPGVGLGLYLARAIVRLHGGELSCKDASDGGAGVLFRMVLPRSNA